MVLLSNIEWCKPTLRNSKSNTRSLDINRAVLTNIVYHNLYTRFEHSVSSWILNLFRNKDDLRCLKKFNPSPYVSQFIIGHTTTTTNSL